MKKTILMILAIVLFSMINNFGFASTPKFDEEMKEILKAYLIIPKSLAADKTDGVKESAKKISSLAKKLDSSTVTGKHAEHYKNIPVKLQKAADELAKAKDIAAMRNALKELSKPMAMWASMSKPKGVSVIYCSMAPGSWLQKDNTTIANPYYGKKMLRCGEIVSGFGAGTKDGHMKAEKRKKNN